MNSEEIYSFEDPVIDSDILQLDIIIQDSNDNTTSTSQPLDTRSKFILFIIQAYAKISNITMTQDIENQHKNQYLDFENLTKSTTIKRGRTKSALVSLLSNFLSWKPKKNITTRNIIRKEYFNTKIIRSFFKLVRHALDGKIPKENNIAFDCFNSSENLIWNELQTICNDNRELFKIISDSSTFPSGGKRGKGGKGAFNNDYYKKIFEHHCVKEAFERLTKLFFIGYQIENLKKRFGISCCNLPADQEHSFFCYSKWGHLHEHLKNFPDLFNKDSVEENLDAEDVFS